MKISEDLGSFVAQLILTIKTESVEWQKAHQAEILKLKEEKALTEHKVKQKLEEMEIQFQGYCERLQMQEEHRTREFQDFLESINQTKKKMLEYYPQMPTPIALMIHHQAAELLRDAWNTPDVRESLKKQQKFMEFMLTVTEDFSELAEGATRKQLPEKTIEFIKTDFNFLRSDF